MLTDNHGVPVSPPWPVNLGSLPELPRGWNDAGIHADFLNLPGLISHLQIDEGKCLITVQAEQISIPTSPECACQNKEVKPHTPFVMRRVLHTPLGRKSLIIDIKRRRWRCESCDKTVTQPLDCMAEGHYKMTRPLLEYIQVWSLLVTELSLSEETGVFVRAIREIREQFVGRLEKEVKFETPRVLGLDGVRADKKRRRVILTDIKAGLVLDLLKSGKKNPVVARIRQFPGWEKIEGFTIDMDKTLLAAVLEVKPDAFIVIDRFHIIRIANQAMDEVRRGLYPNQKEKREPGQPRPRHEAFRMRRAALNEKHLEYMEYWFDQKPGLRTAYDLKEAFMELFDDRADGDKMLMSSADACRFYEEWKCKIPTGTEEEDVLLRSCFQKVLTAMDNWGEYVFNYFDCRYTNAFTESMNRKIKDILRDARGCEFKTLRARIVFGTYLRKLMRLNRELEMRAVMPRPKPRGRPQPNAKGKGDPKGGGVEGGRSSVYELPHHTQMIIDFTDRDIPES